MLLQYGFERAFKIFTQTWPCTFASLLSRIRLSSVTFAIYAGGWNFRQCFFAILYLTILWLPYKIPSARGVKRKRGSKIEWCYVRVSHLPMSFLLSCMLKRWGRVLYLACPCVWLHSYWNRCYICHEYVLWCTLEVIRFCCDLTLSSNPFRTIFCILSVLLVAPGRASC